MRKPKRIETSLSELRARHFYCITIGEIARQVQQGRIPRYWEKPRYYAPHCDNPSDVTCAAPSVSTESIISKIQEAQNESGINENNIGG